MIQFNLLPDVKMQYLRAQKMKQLVISISILASVVFIAGFLLLLGLVDVVQKKSINDLSNSITSNAAKISSNGNLNKILTVQSQIATLPTIETQVPVTSQLFKYMTQVTPATADVSALSADYGLHTITITGNADSLATVNLFVDTLKYTTYTDPTTPKTDAFSQVVLSNFGYSKSVTDGKPASYTISLAFDPNIFSSKNVALTIPPEYTTSSLLNQPSDPFTTQSSTTGGH